MRMETEKVRDYLKRADLYTYMGRIDKIVGTTVEATGPECRIGDVCTIEVAGSSRRWPLRWWASGKTRSC